MYPTDLADSQLQVIEELLADQRKRKNDLRKIFNALFYMVKGGWKTVYYYFRKFQRLGIWQELNETLREKVLAKAGRKPSSSAAIIDSQSVKTTLVGGQRGYDAGKLVKGRKRHIIVDTETLAESKKLADREALLKNILATVGSIIICLGSMIFQKR